MTSTEEKSRPDLMSKRSPEYNLRGDLLLAQRRIEQLRHKLAKCQAIIDLLFNGFITPKICLLLDLDAQYIGERIRLKDHGEIEWIETAQISSTDAASTMTSPLAAPSETFGFGSRLNERGISS
jgi:hypothetical protein